MDTLASLQLFLNGHFRRHCVIHCPSVSLHVKLHDGPIPVDNKSPVALPDWRHHATEPEPDATVLDANSHWHHRPGFEISLQICLPSH